MSSNIEVKRVCVHCGTVFVAKTTVTRYCSNLCAKRAYKARKRGEKIEASNQETNYITNQPIEELKIRPFLSISDTCKLLGISRRTVYRMIERKELPIAKAGTRTILRRSDIDSLFDKPVPVRPKKEAQPVTEFYTVKEVEEKYFIKYGRLNNIINQNDIPKTVHNGKLFVSKPHLDRYFQRTREDVSAINGWYTVEEIQGKYNLTRDQVYGRISENRLPKKREGKYVKISKQHFDELFQIGV